MAEPEDPEQELNELKIELFRGLVEYKDGHVRHFCD